MMPQWAFNMLEAGEQFNSFCLLEFNAQGIDWDSLADYLQEKYYGAPWLDEFESYIIAMYQ